MIAFLLAALLSVPMCTRVGLLPDPSCTPGMVDTADLSVICGTPTATRRHVSESIERAVLHEYGVPWLNRRQYEVDHRVPLEVGGSNDIRNLWPEPIDEARAKDQIENRAHRDVCAGRVSAEEAQRMFEGDWNNR